LSAATAGEERLVRVVFGLLVLACFVAFIVTQRLKHTPTAVQRFQLTPVFSPTPTGALKQEHISFKLASADRVTVTIVDSKDEDVATLVRDLPTPRYKQLSLRWNGRLGEAHGYTTLEDSGGHRSLLADNRGSPAPAGSYSVRVSLRKAHRTVLSQRTFKLVRR
jgi:hypothetical protein